MSATRWFLIAIFFVIIVISSFDLGSFINSNMTLLIVFSIFILSSMHGITRYQVLNVIVLFVITWVISLFFEALSIQTGFPFGHYYYDKVPGPRIFQVPLIIMITYFSMGYFSWILSHVLLRQYHRKLTGSNIFLIPIIASFIMVMWDLCMDPASSTVNSLWVWENGGSYFGVPIQNYFGWFLAVFIIFQIFALYIAKFDVNQSNQNIFARKSFWMEAATIYGIQAVFQILRALIDPQHFDIYGPLALVTVFTMIFVTLLSFITVSRDFKFKEKKIPS